MSKVEQVKSTEMPLRVYEALESRKEIMGIEKSLMKERGSLSEEDTKRLTTILYAIESHLDQDEYKLYMDAVSKAL